MRKAMVTGFAGTVGSEFVRQLLADGWEVEGIDNSEWAVAAFPDMGGLEKRLGDFASVKGEFGLVIHCAAYKHVDLIESNLDQAYANNVAKTESLYQNVTGPVLFISTDKAVEPASFYGSTKMEGEVITKARGGVTARMGNIISSSGSVIPKWEAAFEKGLPLPITDPAMTRYMITAGQAVSRILALYPKASPGDVIIPEMGSPRSLVGIAESVLEAKGLTREQARAYPKETIGRRPGEKTHEKLKWDDEETVYQDLNGIIARR